MIDDPVKKAEHNKIARILLGFAALCLFTSLILNMNSGKSLKSSVQTSGGMIGPIEVKKDFSVYSISVRQALNEYGVWSFVSGDVLDSNKEYLFGFGKEFWSETGYDSDGRWSEAETSYDIKITFPKKGNYYLRFNAEMSKQRAGREIMVTVDPKRGSSLAHLVLGIISVLAGAIVWSRANVSWGDLIDA